MTTPVQGRHREAGGKIAKTEYWGVKSLNYRIRKNRKAHFTLLNVDAPPAAVTEIERQKRINEDVLRFLTIRVEAHEEGPSAMMRKSRPRSRRRVATAAIGATAAIADAATAGRGATMPTTMPSPRRSQRWRNRPWH